MQGGVVLFRGTGSAACRYPESDRLRADDYYLESGIALAAFAEIDGNGEVLTAFELDADLRPVGGLDRPVDGQIDGQAAPAG